MPSPALSWVVMSLNCAIVVFRFSRIPPSSRAFLMSWVVRVASSIRSTGGMPRDRAVRQQRRLSEPS